LKSILKFNSGRTDSQTIHEDALDSEATQVESRKDSSPVDLSQNNDASSRVKVDMYKYVGSGQMIGNVKLNAERNDGPHR